jgi:hypothetical protein
LVCKSVIDSVSLDWCVMNLEVDQWI